MAKEKSVYRGVYKCGNKFRAQIQTFGVQQYLGVFPTELEAAQAYDKHAQERLGPRAKTNLYYGDPDQVFVSKTDLPREKRSKKFGERTYMGVSKRLKKTDATMPPRDDIVLICERNTQTSVPVKAVTPRLARISSDDSCDYSPSELSDRSSLGALNSIIKTEYLTGLLSYDAVSQEFRWIGTWLDSMEGRPTMREFIESGNYFEFRSGKVPSQLALSKQFAYRNAEGQQCGLIRPCSTCFQGFLLPKSEGGMMEKRLDRGFALTFHPVLTDNGPVVRHIAQSIGNCANSTGKFTIEGEFDCDSGLLQATRSYYS